MDRNGAVSKNIGTAPIRMHRMHIALSQYVTKPKSLRYPLPMVMSYWMSW